MVKVENRHNSIGYNRKNLNQTSSCREASTYNNVKLDEDIFFVKTKNFLIVQEER